MKDGENCLSGVLLPCFESCLTNMDIPQASCNFRMPLCFFSQSFPSATVRGNEGRRYGGHGRRRSVCHSSGGCGGEEGGSGGRTHPLARCSSSPRSPKNKVCSVTRLSSGGLDGGSYDPASSSSLRVTAAIYDVRLLPATCRLSGCYTAPISHILRRKSVQ